MAIGVHPFEIYRALLAGGVVERLDERTLVAAGHGRNGFLLAPWTAERITAELNATVGASR